jgi:hypothetical protein
MKFLDKSKSSFFTTEQERRDIKALAALSGLTLSDFIRWKILDLKIEELKKKAE